MESSSQPPAGVSVSQMSQRLAALTAAPLLRGSLFLVSWRGFGDAEQVFILQIRSPASAGGGGEGLVQGPRVQEESSVEQVLLFPSKLPFLQGHHATEILCVV